MVDKKPYFFRYKYNALNKEYNEYMRKIKEDCEIRFCISFDELRQIPEDKLSEEQKEFLRLYKKYLPIVDSDCVMNRVCKYIESIDFHIKQKIRNTQDFDYKLLVSNGFTPNKALYFKICETVKNTFDEWERDRKLSQKNVARIGEESDKKKGFDKDLHCALLKQKLEEICSNEESLANHLVYLFYVDKPSYNKSVLWKMVGKQIYEIVKSKTNVFYFPKKNPNGSLKYLYENYSIEKVEIPKDDILTNEIQEVSNSND